jgi:hypothetical protein
MWKETDKTWKETDKMWKETDKINSSRSESRKDTACRFAASGEG